MIARPFGSALIVGLLLAAVSSVPASAQLIALKTVPVAAGDQFLQTPSDKLGMGGLAIAIADTLGDPFVNPATGARVRESQVFAVPTYYSISNNAGSARTLPFGTAQDIALNMAGLPEMPFPVSAAIGAASFNLQTPLNASDAEQDFALGLSLNDVVVDESLWSLIDPGRVLPRDAAQIALDLDGQAKTFVDLLDVMGLSMVGQSGEVPGELNRLRLLYGITRFADLSIWSLNFAMMFALAPTVLHRWVPF